MKKNNLLIIIVLFLLISNFISAIPQTISIQGKLSNSSNNALSGTYNMIFKIYNVSTGGSALYATSQSLNTDSNGIYNAILNDINLTFTEQYFLGIQVESDAEMSPRINLTSSPYAFRANNSDYWSNLNATNSTQFENVNGLLHLVESWFESKWNSLFRNWNNQDLNTTDDVRFNTINTSSTIYINNRTNLLPPTCSGTDKLTFDGTSFQCVADQLGSGGSGIIASGNNSNGYYIQFADGSMIAWNYNLQFPSTAITSAAGYIYYGGNFKWTFPQAFISPPAVTAHAYSASSNFVWIASQAGAVTNTTEISSILFASYASTTVNINASAIATGRWTTLTNITQNTTSWAVNSNGDTVLFDTTKKVGIGTTNPSSKLEVIGNANITGNLTLGIGKIMYNTTSGSYYYNNGSGWYAFGTGTGGDSLWTNVGGVATYYGNVNITGNLTLGGQVTGQNVSRARATRNTTQTGIIANAYTKVQYATETYDNLGEYDNATNYRFTATEAGYYLIDASVLSVSEAWAVGNLFGLVIYKNGAQITFGTRNTVQATHTDYMSAKVSDVLYLAANDYIEIFVYVARTGNTGIYAQSDYNHFAVQRLNSPITIGSPGGVPSGAIMAFNSESCPAGWIIADGTSGTPDLRGIFIRGSGTSGVLKWANGTYMNAGFGTYQNDSFQGHIHKEMFGTGTGALYYLTQSSGYASQTINIAWTDVPYTDSINGVPRIGAETNPAYYVLTYCMKTAGDSQASNSIWATSGNTILVNNQSNNLSLQNTSTIYYAPVASEPSLGTPHPHEYQIYPDATIKTVGNYTIDLSSQVPVGTTQVYVTGIFQSSTANAEAYLLSPSGIIGTHSYLQTLGSVATITGIVRLNSSRAFVLRAVTGSLTMYEFQMHEYWI